MNFVRIYKRLILSMYGMNPVTVLSFNIGIRQVLSCNELFGLQRKSMVGL
jgi:hypothetical protein